MSIAPFRGGNLRRDYFGPAARAAEYLYNDPVVRHYGKRARDSILEYLASETPATTYRPRYIRENRLDRDTLGHRDYRPSYSSWVRKSFTGVKGYKNSLRYLKGKRYGRSKKKVWKKKARW